MDETKFWVIIEQSRSNLSLTKQDGNFQRQYDDIRAILANLTDSELIEFDRIFTSKLHEAYRWDLWGAAYVIGGGCSNDGFTDFRAWLISMGREIYESALHDPDALAACDQRNDFDAYFFEEFLSITYDLRDYELKTIHIPHPAKPSGDKWKEEYLPKLFPKLTALHNWVTNS